jgi:hypothetical protein
VLDLTLRDNIPANLEARGCPFIGGISYIARSPREVRQIGSNCFPLPKSSLGLAPRSLASRKCNSAL